MARVHFHQSSPHFLPPGRGFQGQETRLQKVFVMRGPEPASLGLVIGLSVCIWASISLPVVYY
jgi:hypothetical protein